MLDGDVPSAQLTTVVEPWFLGAGGDSPPGKVFQEWATEMEKAHGTKFCKDVSELDVKVRAGFAPCGEGGLSWLREYAGCASSRLRIHRARGPVGRLGKER
eukprot:7090688-Prymnesium_polylepis.1